MTRCTVLTPHCTPPRRSRGLAAVEFAIIAPVLLLALLAVAELGRALIHYDTVSYAVRSSARYVSEHAINGTTGVVDISAATVTRARNLAVFGNVAGGGSRRLPNFEPGHITIEDAGGDNIRVTALYPYQPMIGAVLPTFGLVDGPLPLEFSMRIAVTMRAIS